jgi:1-acyl-sn-glycerol-3-phosphate acyltransferase
MTVSSLVVFRVRFRPMSSQVFHTPRPNRTLIRILGWVNDKLVLPQVARVLEVHLPQADQAAIHSCLRSPFVICPNHPEFFTDWMLDKWLTSRFAPLAAPWAAPDIINGMGALATKFWLANNLVAAVRGEALESAIEYSAGNLAAGQGALIHPEGEVNWDNEALGRLKSGCVQIARRGAARAARPALIVPVVWFIRFCDDATAGLEKELDYVQERLGFRSGRLGGPAERMVQLYTALLERETSRFNIDAGKAGQSFLARFDIALASALDLLAQHWPALKPQTNESDAWELARVWIRAARNQGRDAPSNFRHQIGTLERLMRLVPARAEKTHLTQEQVSERIKRLRADWLHGTIRDKASRFIPRAVARREVFMRVGKPVEVAAGEQGASGTEPMLAALSQTMRESMEVARQDGIARLGPPVRYLNPFAYPVS